MEAATDSDLFYKISGKTNNNNNDNNNKWNQQMQTDRTIHNNKPDIVISDNVKETCMLIHVEILEDKCDKEES